MPDMDRHELTAWLRLTLTPGVGNVAARRLLAAFGLPQRIFEQSESALAACVTPAQARAVVASPPGLEPLVGATAAWLAGSGVNGQPARGILTLADPAYPPALLETDDPPLLLYLVGAPRFVSGGVAPFPAMRCVAVVGSRNPTAQGAANARQFSEALGASGLCVVSGLALGVDAAAHEGALAAAANPQMPATIAVVGTGLDRVYPSRNLALARRIAERGVLVSEYPLGTPPLASNFPKRNRIIAGLCQGTLVVEAAPASGSLITARLASEQGREVFAIPGSIHAPQSRGCHALIRQGAKLVESVQDILEELRLPQQVATAASTQAAHISPAVAAPLSAAAAPYADVVDALGYDPVGLDTLVARTGRDAAALQVALLELELDGQVARLHGGLFQRLALA